VRDRPERRLERIGRAAVRTAADPPDLWGSWTAYVLGKPFQHAGAGTRTQGRVRDGEGFGVGKASEALEEGQLRHGHTVADLFRSGFSEVDDRHRAGIARQLASSTHENVRLVRDLLHGPPVLEGGAGQAEDATQSGSDAPSQVRLRKCVQAAGVPDDSAACDSLLELTPVDETQ
jgi:hypothetical protein